MPWKQFVTGSSHRIVLLRFKLILKDLSGPLFLDSECYYSLHLLESNNNSGPSCKNNLQVTAHHQSKSLSFSFFSCVIFRSHCAWGEWFNDQNRLKEESINSSGHQPLTWYAYPFIHPVHIGLARVGKRQAVKYGKATLTRFHIQFVIIFQLLLTTSTNIIPSNLLLASSGHESFPYKNPA